MVTHEGGSGGGCHGRVLLVVGGEEPGQQVLIEYLNIILAQPTPGRKREK